MPKKNSYKPGAIEHGSVHFDTVEGYKFYMTPLNRIFIIVEERPVFPSYQGSQRVGFDSPGLEARLPKAVIDRCLGLVKKQSKIRADWPTAKEEAEIWKFSNE